MDQLNRALARLASIWSDSYQVDVEQIEAPYVREMLQQVPPQLWRERLDQLVLFARRALSGEREQRPLLSSEWRRNRLQELAVESRRQGSGDSKNTLTRTSQKSPISDELAAKVTTLPGGRSDSLGPTECDDCPMIVKTQGLCDGSRDRIGRRPQGFGVLVDVALGDGDPFALSCIMGCVQCSVAATCQPRSVFTRCQPVGGLVISDAR